MLHHPPVSSPRLPRFISLRAVAFALLAGLAAPLTAAGPAAAPMLADGRPAPVVRERSNEWFTTWDLGPSPENPGQHRFTVDIHGAPPVEAELPRALGDSPLRWRLADGAEIAWRLPGRTLALDSLRDREENEAVPPAEPVAGRAWIRRAGRGHEFRLPLGGDRLESRLRLSSGLTARWDADGAGRGGRLAVHGAGGVLRFTLTLAAEGLTGELRALNGGAGEYQLSLAAAPGLSESSGGGTIIYGTGLPPGANGGYQCITQTDESAGIAFSGNPTTFVYAGDITPVAPDPIRRCAGFIRFPINGAIPPDATVDSASINPLTIAAKTGTLTVTVYVRDVLYTFPYTTSVYSSTYYDDFRTMMAGKTDYDSFSVNLGGAATSVISSLGDWAIRDLNRRPRQAGSDDYFPVSFYLGAVTDGNYLRFDSDASILRVTYDDFINYQIAIYRVDNNGLISTGPEFSLHNYGPDQDVGGWTIRTVNDLGVTENWAIPAATVIKRRDFLRIIDGTTTGGNPNTIITGGGVFHLENGTSPYANSVALLRSGTSGEDYVCYGGGNPAPPSGTRWTGGCIPAPSSSVGRILDADSDTAADWQSGYNNGPSLNTGMVGTRWPSSVFINEVHVAAGLDWIELANYGPPVDLSSWSLVSYDGSGVLDLYTIPAGATLGTGEFMWFAEGTYFGINPNPAADNLHRNMGNDIAWEVAPIGGQVYLRDSNFKVRDYLEFGATVVEPNISSVSWIGAPIPVTTVPANLRRNIDLNSWSADGWTVGTSTIYWGTLNAGQNGPTRTWNETGGMETGIRPTSAGHGFGGVINVTKQAAVESFCLPAAPTGAVPVAARMVMKRSGSATVLLDQTVSSLSTTGTQAVCTSTFTPIVMNVGDTVAFMLYVNGEWYHYQSDDAAAIEYLSFGTYSSETQELSYTPTATIFAASGNPTRMLISVIHAPVITNPSVAVCCNFYPLPEGELTVPYSFTHTASGGVGAYTWALQSGSLPPGLSMSTAGVITGTPTLNGTFDFRMRVTDSIGMYSEQDEQLVIRTRLAIATSALPYYDQHEAPYSYPLVAFGGVTPLTWGCTGLPVGLSCDPSTGLLSGTISPSVANGSFSISITVTDAYGLSANKVLTLQVYWFPQILTTSLANGYVGQDYGVQRILAAGGTGVVVWSVVAGVLPPGLTLNTASGVITGVPTATGVYPFTVRYDPAAGGLDDQAFSITVSKATVPPYWVRRGLAGGTLTGLVNSPQFASDDTIAAVSGATAYLSQDGGFFWKRLDKLKLLPVVVNGLSQFDRIITIAFSPGYDGRAGFGNKIIYAAAAASGFHQSSDNGATWSPITVTSPVGFKCTDTLYYRASFYYCLGNTGIGTSTVWRSSAFTSWTERNPLTFSRLFLAPTGRQYAYRSFPEDYYYSDNNGSTWTLIGTLDNPYSEIVFSPNYASDRAMAFVNLDNDVTGATSLMLSFDNGLSFTPHAAIYNPREVRFPPDYNVTTNRILFISGVAGSGFQMLRSLDNGVTFSPTGGGGMPPYKFDGSFRFSPDYAADQTLFALGANGSALFRSQAAGVGWGPSENGLYYQNINAAAITPNFSTSRRAFVGTDSGLFYTADAGKIWRPATLASGLPAYLRILSIVVAPNFSTSNTLFALGCLIPPYGNLSTCQVLKSVDGGVNFASTGYSITGDSAFNRVTTGPWDLQISPNFATDNRLFLKFPASKEMKFYRSTNGGVNFTEVQKCYENFSYMVSPGYAGDNSVYANCGYNGYPNSLISTDGGVVFTDGDTVTGGVWPMASGYRPVLSPTFNRVTGSNGTHSKTLFTDARKSTDGGVNFATAVTAGTGEPVFTPNYSASNTLFNYYPYVPGAGLYKTVNGGGAWTLLSVAGDFTPFLDVNHIAISPNYAADATLLVATGAGLYVSTDGGSNWTLSTGSNSFSDTITAATQDPNREGRIYVGSQDDGVFLSSDDGLSTSDITYNLPRVGIVPTAIRSMLAVDDLSTGGLGDTALLASTANGVYRMTIDAAGNPSGTWVFRISATTLQQLNQDGSYCYVANPPGPSSYRSLMSGGCNSWSAITANSSQITYSGLTGPTTLAEPPVGKGTYGPRAVAGTSASLWSANPASGGHFSLNSGSSWTAAPGTNDYLTPTLSGSVWTRVLPLGINAASGGREVLLGNDGLDPAAGSKGLFLSRDGGDTWRRVSGPGSGLESTSQNVGAVLTAATSFGTTDALVGMNGTTTGGVYLSGDGGEHWMQINSGFDPNSLNISTLVKTSCGGCPVQYYTGTYGSGVYTRTIPVNNPPAITGWCFTGTGCACGAAPGPSGPIGQGFRLCGANFLALPVVEFDGVPATGCSWVSASVITCTGTPVHWAGASVVRVRNTDTRTGYMPQSFTFTGGGARVAANTLRVAKSANNALLTYTCAGCTSPMPQVYRSQNAPFTLNLEKYTGAAASYTNTNALAAGSNSTYFWSVE